MGIFNNQGAKEIWADFTAGLVTSAGRFDAPQVPAGKLTSPHCPHLFSFWFPVSYYEKQQLDNVENI